MALKKRFNKTIELKDNAMLARRPELFYEWDFEKNDELGLDVYEVSFGLDKKVWWICPDCNSNYDTVINLRASRGSRNQNCPYCSGKRVNHTNSLAVLRPDIAVEWHPTLNRELTSYDVTCNYSKKVWWLAECGHEWEAVVYSRTGEIRNKCPYCSGHKVLVGFNDLWTTNPELASLLFSLEDGYRYSRGSHQKVNWKCINCNSIIKNKSIYNIFNRGVSCSKCSDDISFGERYIYNLLKNSGIEFKFDEAQEWSERKRYDFYFKIKNISYIIEVHGLQHYKEGFQRTLVKARTLKQEQKNDQLKERLAKENGIENYIVIDARYSTIEWMKSSILDSKITDVINCKDIDFKKIGELSSKSLIKVACDLWNTKEYNTTKIAKKINVTQATVITYLKRGAEIGWCDYTSGNNKAVVQLSKDMVFVQAWESSAEAGNTLGFNGGYISCVCTGKRNTTKGFRWMFQRDYRTMIYENLSYDAYMTIYYPKKKS